MVGRGRVSLRGRDGSGSCPLSDTLHNMLMLQCTIRGIFLGFSVQKAHPRKWKDYIYHKIILKGLIQTEFF